MPVSIDFAPYSTLLKAAQTDTREMRAVRSTTPDAPVTAPPPRHRVRRDNAAIFSAAMDEIAARSLKDDTYETDHLVDHDHSRALPGGGEGLSPSERK